MELRTVLGLEPIDSQFRWRLPVTPRTITGGNFLFGGVGLAAAIEALESASGRPCVWAAAQFLSYAARGSVVHIDVTLANQGHNTTQARAVAKVDDREIFTVNAALGERAYPHEGQYAERPDVPLPHECPEREFRKDMFPSVHDLTEQKIADGRTISQLNGTPGSGRHSMWVRFVDGIEMSGAALGFLGDWVPSGIHQALGIHAGGNSLDNTIRIVRVVPTEWVLLDIRLHGIANGFAHGLVHIWAEDGTLMATASQSTIVREWKDFPAVRGVKPPLEKTDAQESK